MKACPIHMPESGLSGSDQTTNHAFVLTMVMFGSRLHPSEDVVLMARRDTT